MYKLSLCRNCLFTSCSFQLNLRIAQTKFSRGSTLSRNYFQAKAQEELEKEQYRKFLAKFTAENFLKKVKKDDME